jgi:hypothetical protein
VVSIVVHCFLLQWGMSQHFSQTLTLFIRGVKVTYHDIEAIHPDYFKNLKWMLEASAIYIDPLISVLSPHFVNC